MLPIIDHLVTQSRGRFLTVTFEKLDGSTRTINGRIGVKFKNRTASPRMDSDDNSYLLLWSVRDKGYRRISGRRITRVAVDNTVLYTR
jgi:hypothetical protein